MKKENIVPFFATLQAANPAPKTELEYGTPFELLAAVLLSAQATDVGVNKATRKLFPVANTPQAIALLGVEGLEHYIKTIGLYRSKARHLVEASRMLVEHHGGEVPRSAGRTGGAAGRGPQDGQRGAQRSLRRSRPSRWTRTSSGSATAPAWRRARRRSRSN